MKLTPSHLREVIELLEKTKRSEDPWRNDGGQLIHATNHNTRINKLISILRKELAKHE